MFDWFGQSLSALIWLVIALLVLAGLLLLACGALAVAFVLK